MKRFSLILLALVACSRTTEPQETGPRPMGTSGMPTQATVPSVSVRGSLLDPPLEYIGPHGLRVNATAPEGGPVLRDGDADRRPHWTVYDEGATGDGPGKAQP